MLLLFYMISGVSAITWSGQCVIDDPNRLLDHEHGMGKTNTPKGCMDYCASNAYAFAGVQAWDWCLCGQTSPPTSVIRPDGECHQSCPGDNTKFCGAPWRMNVYETTPTPTTTTTTITTTKLSAITWSGQCVIDDPNRVLDHEHRMELTNTPQVCIDYCASNAYAFAGVQAWKWCWCGQTSPPTSVIRPDGECNQICPGDNTKFCGADWRMNVYETTTTETSCEVWEDINIPGNDLNIATVNEDDRDTWQECRALCNERPECNFFEWQHKVLENVGSGVVVNHCWIKSGISEKVPRKDHVSGTPCREGQKPPPTYDPELTPSEDNTCRDGSCAYVGGVLASTFTDLLSNSTETIEVECCNYGGIINDTIRTCGNGKSCSTICGPYTGCLTIKASLETENNKTCSPSMGIEDWCQKTDVIDHLAGKTFQNGGQRKKPEHENACFHALPIYRLWYCPYRVNSVASLAKNPECCLHPAVRQRNPAIKKKCCNKYKVCV